MTSNNTMTYSSSTKNSFTVKTCSESKEAFVRALQKMGFVLGKTNEFYTDAFVANNTPNVITHTGVPALPMVTSVPHLYKCTRPRNDAKHNHGINIPELKAILAAVANPVMVYDDEKHTDSVVAVTDICNQWNQPIIVPVCISSYSYAFKEECNYVMTMYGKDSSIIANDFDRAVNSNRLLYCDYHKLNSMIKKFNMDTSYVVPAVGKFYGYSMNADRVAWECYEEESGKVLDGEESLFVLLCRMFIFEFLVHQLVKKNKQLCSGRQLTVGNRVQICSC